MSTQEYIDSGILELYVYGSLSEEETSEVQEMIAKHPEVKKEVEAIEEAVIRLSGSVSPYLPAVNYQRIKKNIFNKKTKVKTLRKTSWAAYAGWAATLLLLIASAVFYQQYQSSKETLQVVTTEKVALQEDNNQLENQQEAYAANLRIIRDKNTKVVPLEGQKNYSEAYAQAYYNKESKEVIIDAQGLPEPPEGMVYQVWSLRLDPLTPTSVGLLEAFETNDSKLFRVAEAPSAEAFGITLEPAGGSKTPTMDKLYTLGKV
ncbi:anti-sigma factor [Haloflavibacter putidus]|uniref:Anti-sigma factor n=1 Tax=Haloflavibacter putidus TaxID=2576776 RepID=A0A507ZN13_9FLAO|nr:anti-sigma factor [Haloflavibacter putidus]TQD39116.1 anti-sigma factor [Haloflavibacter putidus]